MTTWAGIVIRMAGLALLLPLVLTRLPVAEVLVWQMLAGILVMATWADFGFSPTFTRIIAFARGGGTTADLEAAMPAEARVHCEGGGARIPIAMADVIGTQRAVYRRLIAAAALMGGMTGTALMAGPVSRLASPIEGWAAWCATGIAALLVIANAPNASIATGHDRITELRRIEAAVSTGQLLSTSAVVLLGGGLFAIAACYSAWSVLLYGLNARLARRVVGGRKEKARLDSYLFRLVWPAAWRSGVGIAMSTGIIQGSGLIYAQYAAPAAAASYLLALRLMGILSPLAQAPFYTKLPSLVRLRAEGRNDEVAAGAIQGMRLALWTYAAGALALVIAAPFALEWIGSEVRLPGEATLALLALAFCAERYCAMHIQLYSMTNHIIWHIVNGVTGMLMILFCLLLWPALGPAAMPAAMLAAYAGFGARYASRLSMRSIGATRLEFERSTALAPVAALSSGLLLWALKNNIYYL